MRNLTNAATSAVLSQQTAEVFLSLLVISHSSLPEPLRFVNSREDLVSNGETYLGFPFEITLPTQDGETVSSISLSICNVDRQITEAIRNMSSTADITFSVVLASSPDDIELGPIDMSLKEVSYNALTVSGTLQLENLVDTAYPSYNFTPGDFPGLF